MNLDTQYQTLLHHKSNTYSPAMDGEIGLSGLNQGARKLVRTL